MHLDMKAIKKVIRLADRYAEAAADSPSSLSLSRIKEYLEDPSVQRLSQCSRELRSYMKTLDYETVLDIEALMWLGRDIRQYRGTPYANQFEEYRNRAARSYPSAAGKEEAVDYIAEKGPLSTYLRDALQFMGKL